MDTIIKSDGTARGDAEARLVESIHETLSALRSLMATDIESNNMIEAVATAKLYSAIDKLWQEKGFDLDLPAGWGLVGHRR